MPKRHLPRTLRILEFPRKVAPAMNVVFGGATSKGCLALKKTEKKPFDFYIFLGRFAVLISCLCVQSRILNAQEYPGPLIPPVPPLETPEFSEDYAPGQHAGSEDDGRFVPRMSSPKSIMEGFEELKDRIFSNRPGAQAGQRPYWGPATIKLTSPEEFPIITSLGNNDPNSFWYTMRPNIFNIPIPDEWDWSNLINTDRSDFTDTPYTVGTGISYLESGFTYTKVGTPDGHYSIRSLPESLYRVGISEDFELRLKFQGYAMIDAKDASGTLNASSFGTQDMDTAFKWQMFNQKNWFPRTTMVAGAYLPTGSNGFSGNSVQPHFNFVQGWGIRRYLYLKHQFGMDYLTQPSFNVNSSINLPNGPSGPFITSNHPTIDSFHSSVSCLFQATKHLGGFVEWYVLYGNFATTNYFDAGYFFYFTPNIQLDGVIGTSIDSPNGSVLFTKMGFSTRW